jgi:hypothetical protein
VAATASRKRRRGRFVPFEPSVCEQRNEQEEYATSTDLND